MMIPAKVSPWTLQSPEQIWDFHAQKLPLKQLKLAEFSTSGTPQDNCAVRFEPLCWSCPKFLFLSSQTESIKIIIRDRTFIEACRPAEPACFSSVSVKVGHGLQRQWRRNDVTRDLYVYVVFSPELCRTLPQINPSSQAFGYCQIQSNNRNASKLFKIQNLLFMHSDFFFSRYWTFKVSLM